MTLGSEGKRQKFNHCKEKFKVKTSKISLVLPVTLM